jgi:O-palmitoleoyl-L-serine hydrolase
MPPSSPPSSASAPASHHLRLWLRRRGRAGAAGATFAVALLAAALLLTLSYYASAPLASDDSATGRSPALVGLTLVRRAQEKGARKFPLLNSPAVFQISTPLSLASVPHYSTT